MIYGQEVSDNQILSFKIDKLIIFNMDNGHSNFKNYYNFI